MTSKEKVKQLVNNFYQPLGYLKCGVNNTKMWQHAKQCALIAVENEYNAKLQAYNEMAEFCLDIASQASIYAKKEKEEVKKEIELL